MWRSGLIVGILLVLAPAAEAFVVESYEPATQYEVQTIAGDPRLERLIIGTLRSEPIMYEVISDSEFLFSFELRTIPTATPPQLTAIVVRVLDPRGVEEVTRLPYQASQWIVGRDYNSGLPYQTAPRYEKMLPAGIYQFEISTADNQGSFMVALGSEPAPAGYWTSLTALRAIYKFYEAPAILMIRSPLIYYPLGILFLLILLPYTFYKTRAKLPFLHKHA